MSDKKETPEGKKIDLTDVTVENPLSDEELEDIAGGLSLSRDRLLSGGLTQNTVFAGINANTVFAGSETFDTVFAESDLLKK